MRHPLPYAFARSSQLLLEDDGQQLVLWHGPAPDVTALSEVLRKHKVRHLLSLDAASLAQRISAAYAQGESSAATVVSEVESDADLSRMMQDLPAVEDLLETADDAPIIRMLNALLTQAARDGASDIHIEPYERHSSVRFRVDGTLREVVQPNRALHAALISRLKIMADLDISEKTPAARRPHQPAPGHPRHRRARVHPAQRPWRTRRTAPLGQEREQDQPGSRGHAGRNPAPL